MGIFDSVASIWTSKKANERATEMAREQNVFSANMANTTHQREVADLKAAGLNPILSAGGNGAPAPTGAGANFTVPNISLPDFTDIIGLNLEQQKVNNQTEMVDLAKKTTNAEIGKKGAETTLKQAQTKLAQKGVIRADVEGKAAKGLDWLWNQAKQNWQEMQGHITNGKSGTPKFNSTKQPTSSGGEIP